MEHNFKMWFARGSGNIARDVHGGVIKIAVPVIIHPFGIH